MIYQMNLKKADEFLEKAEAAYNKNNDKESAALFLKASELYKKVAVLAKSERMKEAFENKAESCLTKSNYLLKESGPKVNKNVESSGDESEFLSKVESFIHKSSVVFSDIGGLEEMKREIKFSLGVSLADKDGLSIQSWRNWLFYGPPGTGKTLMAAATSNLLADGNFYNVKVSSVLSRYFGDSAKYISALYQHARDNSPSVVFLDEFESLCASRDSSESGAERRILSTILAELDGLSEKDSDKFVLTIAATNRPWDLDSAVLSRFDKKIHVPLPDSETRREILNILIDKKGFSTDFEDTENLISFTEGFSGREIEKLVKDVTNQMILEENQKILSFVDNNFKEIGKYKLKYRPLTKKDFARAMTRIKPVTSPKEYEKYLNWNK